MNSYLPQQRTFWWSHFFRWWKKYPHRFTRVFRFASNKLWRVNLRVQLFVTSKYRLRSNGKKKLSNRLMAVILKDFCSENLECSKNQLIFVTAEEVLSMPFLFRLKKKNCLTVSLIGSTYVCFCQKTVLPVFNLTHFDWLSAHFFSPFPHPLPPPSTLTRNQIWPVG